MDRSHPMGMGPSMGQRVTKAVFSLSNPRGEDADGVVTAPPQLENQLPLGETKPHHYSGFKCCTLNLYHSSHPMIC